MRTSKWFLISFLIFRSLFVFSETNVSGIFSRNSNWTLSGSPYNVTGDISVPQGVTLSIEPGVQVCFKGDFQIDVKGILIARGIASAPIAFSGDGDAKPMLLFAEGNVSRSQLSNLRFTGPQSAIQLGHESEISATATDPLTGTLSLTSVVFSNSSVYAEGTRHAATLDILNSTILNTTVYGLSSSKPVTISQSNITGSTLVAEGANKGMTVSNSTIMSSAAILGCCGANLNILQSVVDNSSFTDSNNQYYQMTVKDSKVSNSSFDLPHSDYGFLVSGCSINYGSCAVGIRCKNLDMRSTVVTGSGAGTAVEITGGNNRIVRSKIAGNNVGVRIAGSTKTAIDSSFIYNNASYNLYNKTPQAIKTADVWWGSTLPAEVAQKIYDYLDDATCGMVDVSRIAKTNTATVQLQLTAGGTVRQNNVTLANGSKVTAEMGAALKFSIVPNAGYEIESVIFNGLNVTSQLVKGEYTTPLIVSNGTLSVTFRKIQYRLSVNAGSGGTFSLLCEYGATPSFDIAPAEGMKITSVMFNGKEYTASVINGIFTVPPINSNSTLVVTYAPVSTALTAVSDGDIKVYASHSTIVVDGVASGIEVKLFSLDGKMLRSVVSAGQKIEFGANGHALYIVKAAGKSFKVIL